MKHKSFFLAAAALVISGLALAPKAVTAYKGDPNVQGPNYTAERHEAMTKAFADRNYNAWKELMQGKGRVTQVVNQANFPKFAEAHQLALQGKTDQAAKIRAELGLGLKNGSGRGQGQGYGKTNQ